MSEPPPGAAPDSDAGATVSGAPSGAAPSAPLSAPAEPAAALPLPPLEPQLQPPLQWQLPEPRVEPFRFTGEAGEYFRVWIVNTFLTLVTIGLWSPWAKIRKRRFFLRHTWVAGANFEFHARPWPILRGRLIAGVAFLSYWFAGEINPAYAPVIGLLIALVAPWLVVSSLRFNLANTSYRNLRFAFDGGWRDGVKVFWPLVLVAGLTIAFPPVFDPTDLERFDGKMLLPTIALLLLYPYLHGAFRRLLLNHARFGNAPIRCSTRIRTFYMIYFRGALLAFGLSLVGSALAVGLYALISYTGIPEWMTRSRWLAMLAGWIAFLPVVAGGLIWFAVTQTRLINATFNKTTLRGEVRVVSSIRAWPMARLYIVNTIAVVLTAGLAIPWAAVRTARQRVETTALSIPGDINDIIADAVPTASAAADAATEFFSLDIAL